MITAVFKLLISLGDFHFLNWPHHSHWQELDSLCAIDLLGSFLREMKISLLHQLSSFHLGVSHVEFLKLSPTVWVRILILKGTCVFYLWILTFQLILTFQHSFITSLETFLMWTYLLTVFNLFCTADAMSCIVKFRIPQGDRPSLDEIRRQAAGRAGLATLMELMQKCWDSKPSARPDSRSKKPLSIHPFSLLVWAFWVAGELVSISSSHCVKGGVYPEEVTSPSQRHKKETNNHPQSHSYLMARYWGQNLDYFTPSSGYILVAGNYI